MFAPNTQTKIKTSQELGLRKDFYKGLWEVLYKLESGWFKHNPKHGISNFSSVTAKGNAFNMEVWHRTDPCGTVACIGGWAMCFGGYKNCEYFDEETAFPLKGATRKQRIELAALLYPHSVMHWHRIIPAQAAVALRGYLETGTTDWGRTKLATWANWKPTSLREAKPDKK